MAARPVKNFYVEGRGLLLSGIEVQILEAPDPGRPQAVGHEEATSVQTPPFGERRVEAQCRILL